MLSEDEGRKLAGDKPSQDFASDAFAHAKFIGWTDAAAPLLKAVGALPDADDGMLKLDADDIDSFVRTCRGCGSGNAKTG